MSCCCCSLLTSVVNPTARRKHAPQTGSRFLPTTCSMKYRKWTSVAKLNAIMILPENHAISSLCKPIALLHFGVLVTTIIEQPAFAVTGENNYPVDLTSTLIQSGIAAVWYFLVMPPIIMNWLRLRWFKRKFFEMYLQFMFVFLFFPGLLLWAPFLNFRRFPRDPTMKYPWSTPQDASIDSS